MYCPFSGHTLKSFQARATVYSTSTWGGNDAPAKVEQKEEDILDSWEDCHTVSPPQLSQPPQLTQKKIRL